MSILYERPSKIVALPQPLGKGCLDRLGEKHCIFIFLISPSLMIALIKAFCCSLLINILEILHTRNTSMFKLLYEACWGVYKSFLHVDFKRLFKEKQKLLMDV